MPADQRNRVGRIVVQPQGQLVEAGSLELAQPGDMPVHFAGITGRGDALDQRIDDPLRNALDVTRAITPGGDERRLVRLDVAGSAQRS
jgi:hypothetical protein